MYETKEDFANGEKSHRERSVCGVILMVFTDKIRFSNAARMIYLLLTTWLHTAAYR